MRSALFRKSASRRAVKLATATGVVLGTVLLAAPPAPASARQQADSVTVTGLGMRGQDASVSVTYRCSTPDFTDTLEVSVSNSTRGSMFRSITPARCNGSLQSVTVVAQRMAGPATKAGDEGLVTASLGLMFDTSFLPEISSGAHKQFR